MSGPRRALVTGATGCLGEHLVEALVAEGTHVRALVRESSRTDRLDAMGVEIQRGSLTEDADLQRAVAGMDVVFHLGGLVIDDRPDDTSDELWQQIRTFNVDGSERLARTAVAAGVQRFVFCSSVRLFGFGNQMCWDEDDVRTPSDLYSKGKALTEDVLLRVGRETGLEVVNIRPRFIYGKHDRYVLPKLVQQVQKGWIPIVGGDAICDVIYARDCAQGLMLAAERPVAGQTFNLTSGECLSLREILGAVADALGRRIHVVPLPPPAVYGLAGLIELGARATGKRAPLTRTQLRWYSNDHHFSITRARRDLGYQPRYRLPAALAEIDLQEFAA
jgi:nucleoside-diphosphate-sugar epimerase